MMGGATGEQHDQSAPADAPSPAAESFEQALAPGSSPGETSAQAPADPAPPTSGPEPDQQ
jgi:hypothetical protein